MLKSHPGVLVDPRISSRHFSSRRTLRHEIWEFIMSALEAGHAVNRRTSGAAAVTGDFDSSAVSAGRVSLDVPEAAHMLLAKHAALFSDRIMEDPRGIVLLLLKSAHLSSRKRVQRLGAPTVISVLRVIAIELCRRSRDDLEAKGVFEVFFTGVIEPMLKVV